jgi:pimeloyl-ACP methyl ester carboxylesterase
MQLVVDSLLTQYESIGKGKTVLLIHGWGDDHRTFANLQKRLDGTYQTVALDLPGFGQTQAPMTTWALDDYAHFIKIFLDKAGLQPYAIIGHSNGGAVAIRGISQKTLACDKLVLLGSSGVRDAQSIRRNTFKIIAKIGKVATFWLPVKHRRSLRKKLYGVAGSDMLVAPHLQETFKQTVKQDVQADAMKIQTPTLLIYGENDTATPPTIGKRFASIMPNAELQILPQAGHFVHHEQSEQVAMMIKDFVG